MARWIGHNHEKRAQQYLQQAGLTLVAKNVTYRGSEIDLIMKEQQTWVCVEVKYRQQDSHGHAAETISPAKIHRMGTAFQRYLSDNGINSNMVPMRLDAVVIDGDTINWLKNIAQ